MEKSKILHTLHTAIFLFVAKGERKQPTNPHFLPFPSRAHPILSFGALQAEEIIKWGKGNADQTSALPLSPFPQIPLTPFGQGAKIIFLFLTNICKKSIHKSTLTFTDVHKFKTDFYRQHTDKNRAPKSPSIKVHLYAHYFFPRYRSQIFLGASGLTYPILTATAHQLSPSR